MIKTIFFFISVGLLVTANSGVSVGNVKPSADKTQGQLGRWARDRQVKELGLSPLMT